jgi:hypothetical protein
MQSEFEKRKSYNLHYGVFVRMGKKKKKKEIRFCRMNSVVITCKLVYKKSKQALLIRNLE